ncbi:pilin N-terminal domain-containing protein [Gemelliphila palaticanis]|uniref:Isopeptide-forming domain-containing fimbrial protein n=1 Tax=Gemelliphila palaticanis TaxID=81950 RepID=A0ABX2SXX3_9BACL|nr:pilin N-terminal domain-containing protein [Gemella palaticanis]MBF0715206.1 isopeptide-forming domain-containing fimbrial protein [Gemella palaticanis]NYS47136.1 isopeptide-forming domain-containing fimbrial protein [Gemella palaticanis]
MRNNRMLKSIIAFVFVFGLILSNLSSVFVKAQTLDPEPGTDVVIHKMKLSSLDGWPKEPDTDGKYPGVNGKYDGSKIADLTSYFGEGSQELAGVTFTYWKVDNDTKYKSMVDSPNDFDTVEKVKAHLSDQEGTVTDPTTNEGVTVSNLANGNYWFVENKGSNITGNAGLEGHTLAQAKAVPFGLVLPMAKADGTGNNFGTGQDALHVYPKNTTVVPKVDKDFTNDFGGAANPDSPRADKATPKPLDVGTKVPYEVVTKIPAGNEYKTASWSDRMTEGLTFNNDVVVTLGDVTLTATTDYVVTATTPEGKGFDLALTEAGLAKINKKDAEQTIKITYSATLNSAAIVEIPESNDVTFHYGNNPTNDNTPKPNTPTPNKPNPKDNSIEVRKSWSGNNEPQDWSVNVTLYNAQTGKVVTFTDAQQATVTLNAANSTHKWTGLDADTEYKVVEETPTSGFAPHYEALADGVLTVDNVKTDNPQPLKPTEPKVVTYGKKFVKTDEKGTERLVGAEFLVKNAEGKYLSVVPTAEKTADINNYTTKEEAYAAKIEEYNALSAEEQKGERGKQVKAQIETAKQERDLAFKSIRTNYHWTTEESDALVLTSDSEGRFEITGLAKGTYKLKEQKAPTGFAKLTEEIEFEVGAGTYSADKEGQIKYNLADAETKKDAQQVKNKKVTIPQTGGIGTVIFTVVGALVMASSVIAMRRRKSEE